MYMDKIILHQKKLFSVILDNVSDGIVAMDPDLFVIFMNPAAVRMSGWTEADVRGKLLKQICNLIDSHSLTPLIPAGLPKDGDPSFFQNAIFKGADGIKLIVDGSITQIPSSGKMPPGYVMVFRDISEVKKLSAVIDYQAYHDSLTNLANREGFTLQLEELLDDLRRNHTKHSLMEINIDNFTAINDAGGVKAGDEILRQIAVIIRSQIQRDDPAARLTGDIFTLVLRNCGGKDAMQVAQRLRDAMRDHVFSCGDRTFSFTVSIGVLPLSGDEGDIHRILSAVHKTCAAAKNVGGNSFTMMEQIQSGAAGEETALFEPGR
jgi:diguanylate cyclase (GGDEF)-like protein/PAS domain S-box-containing protein